jgi:putative membrane protein insertion efficiency factor
MVKLTDFLQKSLIFSLQVYRYLISPLMGHSCRFYPSCSKYAQLAIKQYGSYVGLTMTIKRLLRCHPWHPGGYDPVSQPLKPPTRMS